MDKRRLITAAAALLVGLAGCGGDDGGDNLPAGVVAQVDGRSITNSDLAHAMVGRWVSRRTDDSVSPDRRDGIRACVAAGRRKGGTPTDAEELRKRCEARRHQDERAALRLLIQERWYQIEAKRRRIDVPSLRKEARSSATQADVDPDDMYAVTSFSALLPRLLPKNLSPPSPSPTKIRQYYFAHRARYVTTEFRWVQAVLARTSRQAERARAQLENGATPEEVVRRAANPEIRAAFVGQEATAAVDAQTRRLARPLRIGEVAVERRGRDWYVVQLTDIAPSQKLGFSEARTQVEGDLQQEHLRTIVGHLNEKLRERYGTVCADGYDIPECS